MKLSRLLHLPYLGRATPVGFVAIVAIRAATIDSAPQKCDKPAQLSAVKRAIIWLTVSVAAPAAWVCHSRSRVYCDSLHWLHISIYICLLDCLTAWIWCPAVLLSVEIIATYAQHSEVRELLSYEGYLFIYIKCPVSSCTVAYYVCPSWTNKKVHICKKLSALINMCFCKKIATQPQIWWSSYLLLLLTITILAQLGNTLN